MRASQVVKHSEPAHRERITLGTKTRGKEEKAFVIRAKTEPRREYNQKCQLPENGVHCTQRKH
jgi:hypothetical protein